MHFSFLSIRNHQDFFLISYYLNLLLITSPNKKMTVSMWISPPFSLLFNHNLTRGPSIVGVCCL